MQPSRSRVDDPRLHARCVALALRAAVRELQALVDNGLTEEQFELTRTFLKKYVLHFADTTSARLGYAVDDRFYGIGEAGHLERFRRMMDELTLEEVSAAVRKHLQYDRLKIAMVTGDAEVLGPALLADAASPVTYASGAKPELAEADAEIEVFPLAIKDGGTTTWTIDEVFQR